MKNREEAFADIDMVVEEWKKSFKVDNFDYPYEHYIKFFKEEIEYHL